MWCDSQSIQYEASSASEPMGEEAEYTARYGVGVANEATGGVAEESKNYL